ncbi:MAG TPA: hypothetical protein VMA34_13880 [Terracidiphilus sp.]|nr:hypothetical protein [Terracidiphilus sp.]
MSNHSWSQLARRAGFVGISAMLAAGMAVSQTPATHSGQNSASSGWSDSNAGTFQVAEAAPQPMAALPAAPTPSGSAAGAAGGGIFHNAVSHLALEFGGGFNAPESSSVTYGANFTLGAGVNFNPHITGLIEYQFIDDKLPGALIAETGATGGHAHIWSFTLDPVIDAFPKATNDFYVTGGGGFYRKVTSFTVLEDEEFCTYFYCGVGAAPATVGHFSSNQGGWSVGGGYIHRMGGIYGTSKMKLFAEVRYLDVMSPALTSQPNGLGTVTVSADTKLIPVTLGIRW